MAEVQEKIVNLIRDKASIVNTIYIYMLKWTIFWSTSFSVARHTLYIYIYICIHTSATPCVIVAYVVHAEGEIDVACQQIVYTLSVQISVNC